MRQPPKPVSKALLVCRQIPEDPVSHELSLLALTRSISMPSYPAVVALGVFARWTCGHGDYQVEVHLQNGDGDVVFREGPPEPWKMANPLLMFDLSLRLAIRFPAPGKFDFVILANGEEVDRLPFSALVQGQASG